jgi:predicted HTH domain antitoxin
MEKIVLEVSDDLARQLIAYQDRLNEIFLLGLNQVKIQEALMLYKRGVVSFQRAAELAGLPLAEMVQQARATGVKPRYSEDMAQEELQ